MVDKDKRNIIPISYSPFSSISTCFVLQHVNVKNVFYLQCGLIAGFLIEICVGLL